MNTNTIFIILFFTNIFFLLEINDEIIYFSYHIKDTEGNFIILLDLSIKIHILILEIMNYYSLYNK